MAPKYGLGKPNTLRIQTTLGSGSGGQAAGTSASDVYHKTLIEADGQVADRLDASGFTRLQYDSKYLNKPARLAMEKAVEVLAAHKKAISTRGDEVLNTDVERPEPERVTWDSIHDSLQTGCFAVVKNITDDVELRAIANEASDMLHAMREESAQLKERIGRQRTSLKASEAGIVDKRERAEQFRRLEEEAVSKLQKAFTANSKPVDELAAEKKTLEKEVADEAARLKVAVDATQQAQRGLETIEGKRATAEAEAARFDERRRTAQAEHDKLTVSMASMQMAQHTSDQIGSVVATSNAYAGQVAGLEAKVAGLQDKIRVLEGQLGELPTWATALFTRIKEIRPFEEGEEEKFTPVEYISYVVDVLVQLLIAYQTELTKTRERIVEDARLMQEALEAEEKATDLEIAEFRRSHS